MIVPLLRFNTQPPEGGWNQPRLKLVDNTGFNTQPPEGGWLEAILVNQVKEEVSTHSRPKAAGITPLALPA